MKIHVNFLDVKYALQLIIPQLYSPHTICDTANEADLIFVEDKHTLHEVYEEDKFYVIYSGTEATNLPANTRWLPVKNYILPMGEYFHEVQSILNRRRGKRKQSTEAHPEECGIVYAPPEANAETKNILVIDENLQNRKLAIELLGKNHFVTLASGFGEGLKLIQSNLYEVVLCDSQMRPDTKNSMLSIDAIEIGQTVHNGIFLIFHATKRGSRIAIVTDAKNHTDWVSALFDDDTLRQPHVLNEQPVLLINYMGKRWDKIFQAIMAL